MTYATRGFNPLPQKYGFAKALCSIFTVLFRKGLRRKRVGSVAKAAHRVKALTYPEVSFLMVYRYDSFWY